MRQPDDAIIAEAFLRELGAMLVLPDEERRRYANTKGAIAYVGGVYVALVVPVGIELVLVRVRQEPGLNSW